MSSQDISIKLIYLFKQFFLCAPIKKKKLTNMNMTEKKRIYFSLSYSDFFYQPGICRWETDL